MNSIALQIGQIGHATEFLHPTGYRRIVGELRSLGISVSATSVRTILARRGLPPAPQRDELPWRKLPPPARGDDARL